MSYLHHIYDMSQFLNFVCSVKLTGIAQPPRNVDLTFLGGWAMPVSLNSTSWLV